MNISVRTAARRSTYGLTKSRFLSRLGATLAANVMLTIPIAGLASVTISVDNSSCVGATQDGLSIQTYKTSYVAQAINSGSSASEIIIQLYEATSPITGYGSLCSIETSFNFDDIVDPPTGLLYTPAPPLYLIPPIVVPTTPQINQHYTPSTASDGGGVRGSIEPSGGFALSTGTPGFDSFFAGSLNQTIYVPFVVQSAGAGSSLSIYGPAGVLWSQPLSSYTVGDLYFAVLNPQATDSTTQQLLTYWVHSPTSGTSEVYFPAQLVVATGNTTTTVPNVVGDTLTAATTAITAASLTLGTVTMQASATVPAGEVVNELPAAGVSESDGTAVNLVTSSGPATATVPNVVELTQAAATTSITSAGLTLGTVTRQSSAMVPSGEVVSQSPGAGNLEIDGTVVNLVISTGPPVTTVPNVLGNTLTAATTAITGASLTLGTVTRQASATFPSGEVVSELPAAGVSESDGTAVNLVISTGPPTTTVPNVLGDTLTTATKVITGASLTLGTVTMQANATVPLGGVVSESPAAGVSESDGTAVNLITSAGPPTVAIVLSGAPTIASGAQGWIVTINLTNSGNVTVQTLQEVSATLNGVASTGVSVPSGHVLPIAGLAPGSSAAILLTFPAAAAVTGAAVQFGLNGSYSAPGLSGNWSVSLRSLTLP